MGMMEIRRRVLLHQAKPAVPQPIYHIENTVCNGDFYHEIPELRTGKNDALYSDDWTIAIDLTPTKLYTFPVGAFQGFAMYINWSGAGFYNSSLSVFSEPWQRRHKIIMTHKAGDGQYVYAHSDQFNDGTYTVTTCKGFSVEDDRRLILCVGWDNSQTSGRQFYGTIHDLNIWHGYVPSEEEIKAYIGVS